MIEHTQGQTEPETNKNQTLTEENNRDETQWKETPYLMIKGFLMGSADIVPGVSGGTMALITGIYDRLIFAIKSFDSRALKSLFTGSLKKLTSLIHWKFLFLLASGMVLAVIFFTRIVPLQIYMFTHAEIVYGLFFGLILGSVFMLVAEIEPKNRSWKLALPLLCGTLFGFWVVTLVPGDTPETFWFVFITGSIAISAMILPGISGSYILLIFQKYDYILGLLSELGGEGTVEAAIKLAPFVFGMATGLVIFSRVLSWLLKRYYTITIVVLIGFLIGSLYVIWPYQHREFQEQVTQTETIEYTDPLVQSIVLQELPGNQPVYQRIAEVIETAEDGETPVLVEVETVSRKIISNEPYIPWTGEEDIDRAGGVTGMVIGLVLIIGISYLRKRS